jgi:hypothetical protein
MSFNSDTTDANYSRQQLTVATTTVAGATANNRRVMESSGGNSTGEGNPIEIFIMDYTSTTLQRNWHSQYLTRGTRTLGIFYGWWTNTTNAVTQIDLVTSGNNFTTSTSYMLLGCV